MVLCTGIGGDQVLVYWLKRMKSRYTAVFMGEVDRLEERNVKALFAEAGVPYTKNTGIAVVRKIGNDYVTMEMYENGIQQGLTERMQEWKAYAIASMFEHARKYWEKGR